MRLFDSLEYFIYRSRRSRLITVGLLLSFLKTGVWYMPNLDMWRAVAINPFKNPFSDPTAHYIFWNWLSPFLAWLLKLNGERSFFYFHLAFSVAFTATIVMFLFSTLDERSARTSFVLFLALPASATAYFWVGMDSVTLLLMASLLVFRTRWYISLLLGIALGMQHFEQGLVATSMVVAALILSWFCKDREDYSIPWALCSWVGVILGKLILIAIVKRHHIYINSGRFYYFHENLPLIFPLFAYHFEYILWSVLGVGWMAVMKFVELGRRAVPFLVCLLGSLVLLPFVSDETRVICIVTFPLAAIYLLSNRTFLESLEQRSVSWIFAFWVLAPYGWVWGVPKWSLLPYDVAYVLHRYFGWFAVPQGQPLWPF